MFGVLGAVSILTPDGSAGSPVRMAVMAIIATTTVPFAVIVSQMSLATAWWSKPGRLSGMNNGFAIYADGGLAMGIATFQNPVLALAASSLFGVIGGYVANFVRLRVVIFHMVFSTTVIVISAVVALVQGVDTATVAYLVLVAMMSANGLVLLLRRNDQDLWIREGVPSRKYDPGSHLIKSALQRWRKGTPRAHGSQLQRRFQPGWRGPLHPRSDRPRRCSADARRGIARRGRRLHRPVHRSGR
ncbi:hypothetical protein ABLE94_22260 [Gordonia sp. VNK1]|uniref:hypothetical protein n=1 Tax=Gordonia oleivorans TaxID=3156618 RepID=UPI0032B4ED12